MYPAYPYSPCSPPPLPVVAARHRARGSNEKWHERWRPRFTGRPGPTITCRGIEVKARGDHFE